ncbi:hypothetical protein Drorol1_Dr00007554 [Drosera rotundifolia]
MGNVASCAPSIISNGRIKVLKWDGTIEAHTRPIKVSELMVQNPGHFLCDPSSLQVGHRIPGIFSEDELHCPRFYLLLPMDMLYAVLTFEEMSHLRYKASRASRYRRERIFPLCVDFKFVRFRDSVCSEDVVEAEDVTVTRLSSQRSWKPALETVVEVT